MTHTWYTCNILVHTSNDYIHCPYTECDTLVVNLPTPVLSTHGHD